MARGYDPRDLVTRESKEPALVTCHQIIGLARFGHGQQKIVGGIRRSVDAWQRAHIFGKPFQFVHETTGPIGLDALRDRKLAQRAMQLVELGIGQEREIALLPGATDGGRVSLLEQQGENQNLGIEHHAHQALSAFSLVRLSSRTSRTASSMMFCRSSGSDSALGALMS